MPDHLFAPKAVLGLFMDTSDEAATSIAVVLLAIAVFQQFADSAQNIGIGLRRGAEDTTSSFAITLIGSGEWTSPGAPMDAGRFVKGPSQPL